MNYKHLLLVGVILQSTLTGCSKKPDFVRAAASGTVTLDGQPLEEGTIQIYPDVKVKGTLAQTTIKGGKFSFTKENGPSTGANRVAITAMKKTGNKVTNDGIESEETVQYIPWQYNEDTSLRADIKPNANDDLKFDLTGQAQQRVEAGQGTAP